MIEKYGLLGTLELIYFKLRTILLFRNLRLIRFPIDLRNKHLIFFGEKLTTGRYCRIEAHNYDKTNKYKITFGKNVQINDNVHIVGGNSVQIGDNVLMASHIFISDTSHGNYNDSFSSAPSEPPAERKEFTKPEVQK